MALAALLPGKNPAVDWIGSWVSLSVGHWRFGEGKNKPHLLTTYISGLPYTLVLLVPLLSNFAEIKRTQEYTNFPKNIRATSKFWAPEGWNKSKFHTEDPKILGATVQFLAPGRRFVRDSEYSKLNLSGMTPKLSYHRHVCNSWHNTIIHKMCTFSLWSTAVPNSTPPAPTCIKYRQYTES
jgi:hypothetical protein